MNGFVQIGPLALATDRLLAVVLILVFVTVMDRIAARAGADATRASGLALVAGVIVARLAYVQENFSAYAQDWWSALAFWQGGFNAAAGLLAAAAVIAWRMRPRAAMLQGLLLLGLVGAAWYGTSALIRPAPQPMPALPALERLDGGEVLPGSLNGKPYVINLWATWCPPCRRELPMLAEVAATSDVPILLVNQGEDADTVLRYLAIKKVSPANIVLDRKSGLSAMLESQALPATLFVDREGRIVEFHIGELSRAALLTGIEDLQRE